MTKEQLLNKIEGAVNDACDGATTREEAIKDLATAFSETLEPFHKARVFLRLFIYRVYTMRALQQQYFNGKKSVLPDSKQEEQKVDRAIAKLTGELGYSIEDLKKLYEAPKLDL